MGCSANGLKTSGAADVSQLISSPRAQHSSLCEQFACCTSHLSLARPCVFTGRRSGCQWTEKGQGDQKVFGRHSWKQLKCWEDNKHLLFFFQHAMKCTGFRGGCIHSLHSVLVSESCVCVWQLCEQSVVPANVLIGNTSTFTEQTRQRSSGLEMCLL